jgi:hypothetical protein
MCIEEMIVAFFAEVHFADRAVRVAEGAFAV